MYEKLGQKRDVAQVGYVTWYNEASYAGRVKLRSHATGMELYADYPMTKEHHSQMWV